MSAIGWLENCCPVCEPLRSQTSCVVASCCSWTRKRGFPARWQDARDRNKDPASSPRSASLSMSPATLIPLHVSSFNSTSILRSIRMICLNAQVDCMIWTLFGPYKFASTYFLLVFVTFLPSVGVFSDLVSSACHYLAIRTVRSDRFSSYLSCFVHWALVRPMHSCSLSLVVKFCIHFMSLVLVLQSFGVQCMVVPLYWTTLLLLTLDLNFSG